ncbi:hypothetical protein KKB40_00210 [Patescibacteria group bacterium]|nr:hypothetical protein [Patescibacteria group bacterium]
MNKKYSRVSRLLSSQTSACSHDLIGKRLQVRGFSVWVFLGGGGINKQNMSFQERRAEKKR